MLTNVVSHVVNDRFPHFTGRSMVMALNLLAQALKPIQLARASSAHRSALHHA